MKMKSVLRCYYYSAKLGIFRQHFKHTSCFLGQLGVGPKANAKIAPLPHHQQVACRRVLRHTVRAHRDKTCDVTRPAPSTVVYTVLLVRTRRADYSKSKQDTITLYYH
jgi:hypothetical protein